MVGSGVNVLFNILVWNIMFVYNIILYTNMMVILFAISSVKSRSTATTAIVLNCDHECHYGIISCC